MTEQRNPESQNSLSNDGTSDPFSFNYRGLKPMIGAIEWLLRDRHIGADSRQRHNENSNRRIDSNDAAEVVQKEEQHLRKKKSNKKKSAFLNSGRQSETKDQDAEWTNIPLSDPLRTIDYQTPNSLVTDRLCRCKVCGQLLPQDIDSIERHTNHCGNIEASDSGWAQATALRALSPKELVGCHIQLNGGVIAKVIEEDKRTSGAMACHVLRFESGRQESTLLFDGKNDGALFRLLSFEEERRYNEVVQQRLEEELRRVRLHMQDVQKDSHRRSEEAASIRSELEHLREETADRDLCPVCFDSTKDTVFNCGHRTCSTCAQLCMDSEGGLCPICRQPIETLIKLFDA